MGNEEVDFARLHPVAVEDRASGFLGIAHGKFEHRRAILLHVVKPLIDRLQRRRPKAAAGGHAERIASAAVNVVFEVEDPDTVIVGGFDDDRTSAIAKKYAGCPIGVVDDARHHVRADHERMLAASGHHHLRRRRERVGEARTGGAEIESPRVRRADLVLDEACGAREHHVRSGGADDDEVDIGRGEAGAANGLARRFGGQVRRGHARVHDVALTDAGSLQNPLVGCIDQAFEVGVRQQLRRHIRRQAGNARAARRVRGSVGYHNRESLPGAVSPKYS